MCVCLRLLCADLFLCTDSDFVMTEEEQVTFALQASKEDRVSYPSPPPRSSADGERKVWLRLCCSLTHFHRRRPPRPRPRTALARRCLRAPRRLLLFRLRPALLNPLSGSLRSMCVAACIGCVFTCVCQEPRVPVSARAEFHEQSASLKRRVPDDVPDAAPPKRVRSLICCL